ncbi:MAG: flagellar basal body-associated FliL family protein [Deltaproteobacteria bacterium]|nr:flagellar basal body-associated FliL family protein [Deltaproteobacteria bacterium]
MAEDAKKKDEKHEDAPPKKGLNKMIIIGGAVALLLVLGAGAFFFLNKKDKGADKEDVAAADEEPKAKKEKGKEKEKEKGSSSHGGKGEKKEGAKEDTMGFAALEPFIVNLMDNTGTRYLKITIQLEMDKQEAVEEVKARTPQIRDAVLVLLSSKTYADIGTVQGKYQLRDEVIARVNQILKDGKAKTAYFTEFVVQ